MEEGNRKTSLFHTRCKVSNKVCILNIDEGSSKNIASTYMVEKLALPTLPHPQPYQFQGLHGLGEFEVTTQVLVSFSIGKYEDEVLCDVMPIQSCHLLFGGPWKSNREGAYKESKNLYSLIHKGKRFSLIPPPPEGVMEDQLRLKAMKKEEERKERELKAEKERLEREAPIELELAQKVVPDEQELAEVNIEQAIDEVQGKEVSTLIAKVPMVHDDVVNKEAKQKEFIELLSQRYIQREEFFEYLPLLKGLAIDVPDLKLNSFKGVVRPCFSSLVVGQDLRTNLLKERGDDVILIPSISNFSYTFESLIQESFQVPLIPFIRSRAWESKRKQSPFTPIERNRAWKFKEVQSSWMELVARVFIMFLFTFLNAWKQEFTWFEVLSQEGSHLNKSSESYLVKLEAWRKPRNWRKAWR